MKDPILSMNHLLVHIDRDKKKEINKDKDSAVHTTEYGSKQIQVKPRWAQRQTQHQAPIISSIDKSLNRYHHRVCRPTHWRAMKEESRVANRDWVYYQACSLLQYINEFFNLFIMRNYFLNCAEKILMCFQNLSDPRFSLIIL